MQDGESGRYILFTTNYCWPRHRLRMFIIEDSAGKKIVASDIFEHLNKIPGNPEFFPPDKYKQNNDGSYRAFEKHHYRIAYRFTDKVIRVLRVRHVSREPKEY